GSAQCARHSHRRSWPPRKSFSECARSVKMNQPSAAVCRDKLTQVIGTSLVVRGQGVKGVLMTPRGHARDKRKKDSRHHTTVVGWQLCPAWVLNPWAARPLFHLSF